MVHQSTALKAASFLFHNAYFVYKPLYYRFKKIQDKSVINLFNTLVKPGDVIIDAGANIGFYSSMFCNLVGESGKVYSFEPDNKNFKKLTKAVEQFKNCELINAAISQNSGVLKFYTSHRLNVDHRTIEPEEYDSVEEVKCFALDDYFKIGKKIDFVKMDIQGAELDALNGMKRLLTENPDVKVISEFWPYGILRAGHEINNFFSFIDSLDFNIKKINPDGSLDLLLYKDVEGKTEETFDANILISKKSV